MERLNPDNSHTPVPPEVSGHALSGASLSRSVWVRDCDLHRVLIGAARSAKWNVLESYLNQMSADERVRGAPLMRALNTPLNENGMPLLAVMIVNSAPLGLMEQVVQLGAAVSPRFSVREPSGGRVEGYTLVHLAILKGIPEVLGFLPPARKNGGLDNARGESPLRLLARLGTDSWFEKDAVQQTASMATRRYLQAGGEGTELKRAVSMFVGRRAWAIAEAVLDSWAMGDIAREQGKVPGSDICKWAWFGVHENAPQQFFRALHGIAESGMALRPFVFAKEVSNEFLTTHLPSGIGEKPRNVHDWSALTERLEKLELCRGLIPSDAMASFINSREFSLVFKRGDSELEELGLIDPVTQLRPLSFFQAMLYGGAPRRAIELALKLGADTSYSAWVGGPGETLVDGAALHVAITREDPEAIEALLRAGAPRSQRNKAGQTEAQYLFGRYNGDLPFEKLPLLELLLRGGGFDSTTVDSSGRALANLRVAGFRFGSLLDLASSIGKDTAEAEMSPSVLMPDKYEVLDGADELVEVSRAQLAKLVEREYQRHLKVGRPGQYHSVQDESSDDFLPSPVLNSALARLIAERIHYALLSPFERQSDEPGQGMLSKSVPPDTSESDYSADQAGFDDVSAASSEEDVRDEGEFLSFPDFSGAEFGFTYEDPESDAEELEENEEQVSSELYGENTDPELLAPEKTDQESELGTIGTEQAEQNEGGVDISRPLMEMLELTEDDFTVEPATAPVDSLLAEFEMIMKEEEEDPLADMVAAAFMFSGDRSSRRAFEAGVKKALKEGELYEAYLLLKCLDEISSRQPSKLSAISRSLKSLLYRFHPSVANHLGMVLDASYHSPNGYHPYMAEFLCMLRNPLDKQRSPASIGGLTLGITAVARLMSFGTLTGDLVDAWGQIGTWNFAFPVWRFDAQPTRQEGVHSLQPSLMELAGFEKIRSPVDEFQKHPVTGKQEHLLGPLFRVAAGTPFHQEFDQETALMLGFAALEKDTTVLFRRACIIISHPAHGTLIVRNSSQTFGRDRLKHPGLWKKGPMSSAALVSLRKETIDSEFVSIVGQDFFRKTGNHGHYGQVAPNHGAGVSMSEGSVSLNFLMGQASTVRAAYSRMKCDMNPTTAWGKQSGALVGGYRSPLFRHVVSLLQDRLERAQVDGAGGAAVPDLAFANPDYLPAPHARLPVTAQVIDVLQHLCNGEEKLITERQLRTSGVGDFFDAGFKRGRNSELLLLPADGS